MQILSYSARRKKGTALTQAIDLLRDIMRELAAGERLPSVRALAQSGRFSASTIRDAIRFLSASGELRSVAGGGVFVAGAPPAHTHAKLAHTVGPAVRALAATIGADLFVGAFGDAHRLPSAKELSVRYGACSHTLQRALESLERAGRLERTGSRWRAPELKRARSGSRIALLSAIESRTLLTKYNSRSAGFWSSLQTWCLRRGVTFDIVHASAFFANRRDSEVLGYIVLALGYGDDSRSLEALLRAAAATGRPVALLDDDGVIETERLAAMAPSRNVRLFGMRVFPVCGEVVGGYRAARRHRRVAVFSLVDSSVWCRARAEGIERAYGAFSAPDAVTRFTLPGYTSLADISADIAGREPYVTFRRHIDEFHAALPGRLAQRVQSFYDVGFDFYTWVHFMLDKLAPLFDRALEDSRITAWTAVTDMVGFMAMEHLALRGVKTGSELSLVAFDDLPEAFSAGLSSYRFNISATVREMLNHVIDWRPRARSEPGPPLEIPGRVMERQTSGERS